MRGMVSLPLFALSVLSLFFLVLLVLFGTGNRDESDDGDKDACNKQHVERNVGSTGYKI